MRYCNAFPANDSQYAHLAFTTIYVQCREHERMTGIHFLLTILLHYYAIYLHNLIGFAMTSHGVL